MNLDRSWNFADEPCTFRFPPCSLPKRTHMHVSFHNGPTLVVHYDERPEKVIAAWRSQQIDHSFIQAR
jgi:hypothetical protein